MSEIINQINFTTGMKVVCRNGVELIVLLDFDESFLVQRKCDTGGGFFKLRDFSDTLEYIPNRIYDIDKVYKPTNLRNIFEDKEEKWELLWTRPTVVDWDTARDSGREIKPLENFTNVGTLDNFQELDEVGKDMACLSMEEIIKLIEGQWIIKGVD